MRLEEASVAETGRDRCGCCPHVGFSLPRVLPTIVHCNLKASNVLLDKEGRPREIDFALARVVQPSDSETTWARERFECVLRNIKFAYSQWVAASLRTTRITPTSIERSARGKVSWRWKEDGGRRGRGVFGIQTQLFQQRRGEGGRSAPPREGRERGNSRSRQYGRCGGGREEGCAWRWARRRRRWCGREPFLCRSISTNLKSQHSLLYSQFSYIPSALFLLRSTSRFLNDDL